MNEQPVMMVDANSDVTAAAPIDPQAEVEREEEVQRIVQILCRLPEKEQMVFELSAIEGFSNDQVAKIAGVRPDEVPKIAEKVKAEVLRQLEAHGQERKAS